MAGFKAAREKALGALHDITVERSEFGRYSSARISPSNDRVDEHGASQPAPRNRRKAASRQRYGACATRRACCLCMSPEPDWSFTHVIKTLEAVEDESEAESASRAQARRETARCVQDRRGSQESSLLSTAVRISLPTLGDWRNCKAAVACWCRAFNKPPIEISVATSAAEMTCTSLRRYPARFPHREPRTRVPAAWEGSKSSGSRDRGVSRRKPLTNRQHRPL